MSKAALRQIRAAGYTLDDAVTRLAAIVADHLASAGITPRQFGMAVLADPCFCRELRKGRECRIATAARVLTAIANWKREGSYVGRKARAS